jgi:hypothetical protein
VLEQSRGSRSAITSTCRTGRSPRRSLQRSESVVVRAYRDGRETGEVDVEVEQARNGIGLRSRERGGTEVAMRFSL